MRIFDIAGRLAELLGALPDWLVTLVISMTPFVELRLSLPVAIGLYGMPWYNAFAIAVIGNIIPIPFILLFMDRLEGWLRRFKWWDKTIDRVFNRTRKKASKTIERFEVVGLWLYVAIPLPVTGAWTGSLIAYIFDLDKRRAFYCVTAGVLTAGLIVLFVTQGVIWALNG